MKALIAEILRLEPGWKDATRGGATDHYGKIQVDPNGAAIEFWDHSKDKFRVSGARPQDRANSFYWLDDKTVPSIGISDTRPAADVIKDIKRRLLPEYLADYPAACEIRDRWDGHLQKHDETEEAVKKARSEKRLSGWCRTTQVSNDGKAVSFHTFEIPLDKFWQIVELMNAE